MRIAENLSLEDLDYREALSGLAELNYIVSVGRRSGLTHAEVTELALQAEYLNGLAMAGMEGFFKKTWKKIRKKTHKLRYKALKIIRKIAPILSLIPVIGIPFTIAHGLIEAQQAHQMKKRMKDALSKARKEFQKQMGKEEKDMNEEEKKAAELYAATQVKIAAAGKRWSKELEEEEKAAQILLEQVKKEFGPQAKKIVETAEKGGDLTVPTSKGPVPIPPDPILITETLPPGITAATGTDVSLLPAASTSLAPAELPKPPPKKGAPVGLLVGGGLAVGGILILMAKKKKRRR
jgi:hypothetical protein